MFTNLTNSKEKKKIFPILKMIIFAPSIISCLSVRLFEILIVSRGKIKILRNRQKKIKISKNRQKKKTYHKRVKQLALHEHYDDVIRNHM